MCPPLPKLVHKLSRRPRPTDRQGATAGRVLLAEPAEATASANPSQQELPASRWGLARVPDLLWSPWLQETEEVSSPCPRKTKPRSHSSAVAARAGCLPHLLAQGPQGPTQEAQEIWPRKAHGESKGHGDWPSSASGTPERRWVLCLLGRGPHSLPQARLRVPCLRDAGLTGGAASQQSENRLH